jgi:lipid-binding SYLF domain-containing protein
MVRALGVGAAGAALATAPAMAEDAQVIDVKVRLAFDELYNTVAGARELAANAKGVLMMPDVTKGGFLIGGAYGEGALLINQNTVGYYSVGAASFGFQAGLQSTKHALFFMTTAALEKFRRSDGWELGLDAEFTVPGKGLATGISTTTEQAPIILVVFGQDGLLLGASIEGAKYSPLIR